MNLKPLVLGVVIGFAAAVTPACGGDDSSACNSSNCAGCCFQGTCMADPSPNACGASGSTCHRCQPGQDCILGNCVSQPPDAGLCNRGNCPSCCFEGFCIPNPDFSHCGSGGGACKTCELGEACGVPDGVGPFRCFDPNVEPAPDAG